MHSTGSAACCLHMAQFAVGRLVKILVKTPHAALTCSGHMALVACCCRPSPTDLEVRALRLHTCPLSPSATDLPTGCAARALLWLEQVCAAVL